MRRTEANGMGRETLRVGGAAGSVARTGAGMGTSAWERVFC